MKKRKLLLITAISSFPQDSGGATRIKNTIKELSNYFDLYLVSFKNQEYQFTSSEKNNLKKWSKKNYFISICPKLPGSFIDLGQPYWFSDWYSPELINITNHLIKEINPDIVQIEFTQLLYLRNFIKPTKNQKIIFTAHDISTISFFRRWIETSKIKNKIIHFFRLIEIYFYEKKYLPKFDQIITVSQKDKKTLHKFLPKNKIVCVENGIEKINFIKPRQNSKTINLGYIGSFRHTPNKTAFIYFVEKIAPELEKGNINYKYFIAGRNDDIEIQTILKKTSIKNKIINLGFVKNPKDFFSQIDILITPIFSGSGSRIKILESLSYGKKIISSPVGAEGIEIKTNLISIANTPKEYVEKIKNFKTEKIDYIKEAKTISDLTWNTLFKQKYQSI